MPKKKGGKRGKRNSRRGTTMGPISRGWDRTDRIFRESFRINTGPYSSGTTAGVFGIQENDISPAAFGSRGIAFADLFSLYRVVGFRVVARPHPGTTSVGWSPGNVSWYMGVIFAPKSTYTVASSITQFVDYPHYCWTQDYSPSVLSLSIGRKELLQRMQYKWLKTATTGATDPEVIQFNFSVATIPLNAMTVAGQLDGVVEYDVEFSSPIDPALIPGESDRVPRGLVEDPIVRVGFSDKYSVKPTLETGAPKEHKSTGDDEKKRPVSRALSPKPLR